VDGSLHADTEQHVRRKRKFVVSKQRTLPFLCVLVFAGVLLTLRGETQGAEVLNVRLVGYSDLQGRAALQVTVRGNYAYVGHHRGKARNPMTGLVEPNGTTILNVSEPKNPKIVIHLPGRKGAESRAVQVVEGYYDGRSYLLRNQETRQFTGFEVWDITDRRAPRLVSEISGLHQAHKGWWDVKTGHAFFSGVLPGWKGRHLIIYDLTDPHKPRFVTSWGLPGQAPGETGRSVGLHHPVVFRNRAYLSYLFGGDVVVLDISDKTHPKQITHIDSLLSSARSHTTVPYFVHWRSGGKNSQPQQILVVSEEALASGCWESRPKIYIFDAENEAQPSLLASFQVPDGDFCERGGRFGPHQIAETKDGKLIAGSLLYIAYFNAGLRIVDISEPSHPKEVGHYVPDPTSGRPVQTNDVDLDYRGLIYITDRSGGGLHILEFHLSTQNPSLDTSSGD
jgi:hypothetical protein